MSRTGPTATTPREQHGASFPETIPEETSSIEEEHVMIFSLPEEEEEEAQGRTRVYKVRIRHQGLQGPYTDGP